MAGAGERGVAQTANQQQRVSTSSRQATIAATKSAKLRELACLSRSMPESAWRYLIDRSLAGARAMRSPAILPLHRFAAAEEFLQQLSKNVRRDARLAARHGYTCHALSPENFLPDLLSIVRSRPRRQRRAMRDTISPTFAKAPREPEHFYQLPPIVNPQHYKRWFGLFRPEPGYRQGRVQTDERLLAFISLTREGELASYRMILGHGDYLRHGIMFRLHLHVVRWILDRAEEGTRGIKYLMYAAWQDGTDGMRLWKSRAGFSPYRLIRHSATGRAAVRPQPFPQYVLERSQSAAGLFCAAFGGCNDVIHFQRAGLKDVTLVDHDAEKLAGLQQRFPSSWHYFVGDAFEAAAALSQRRQFDVVTCDAWSQQFEKLALKCLPSFLRLARQYLLVTVVPHWAEALGYGPDWFQRKGRDYQFYQEVRRAFLAPRALVPARMQDLLSRRHGRPIVVCDVQRRTSYLGGCYWLVVRCS